MDAIAWVEQGKQQLQWSLWPIALQSFERAISIDEDCLAAWEGKAEALRKLGKWNEVVVEVDEKITSLRMLGFMLDADFYISKGAKLSDDLEQYEAAIDCFNQALRLESTSYIALYCRGVSLDGLGRKEEAIVSYKKAIECKPDYHYAWVNHGMLLSALERNKEAIVSFDKAVELKPNDHNAWNNRGNSLIELGRYEEAIASFDKAIEFKPDLHEAWDNRGIAAGNSHSNSPYILPLILNQRPANLHHKHPELNQRGYKGQVASLTVGLIY